MKLYKKVVDQNTSLAERIRTLFLEQGIAITSILTAFSMTISTIVLAITGVFGGGSGGREGAGGSPPKDEGWLDKLANALKGLAGKAFEIVKAIVVNILGAILSFLKRPLDLLLNIHGP